MAAETTSLFGTAYQYGGRGTWNCWPTTCAAPAWKSAPLHWAQCVKAIPLAGVEFLFASLGLLRGSRRPPPV